MVRFIKDSAKLGFKHLLLLFLISGAVLLSMAFVGVPIWLMDASPMPKALFFPLGIAWLFFSVGVISNVMEKISLT